MYRPGHIHRQSLYECAFGVHKSLYPVEHQLEPIVKNLEIVVGRGCEHKVDLREYLYGVVLRDGSYPLPLLILECPNLRLQHLKGEPNSLRV